MTCSFVCLIILNEVSQFSSQFFNFNFFNIMVAFSSISLLVSKLLISVYILFILASGICIVMIAYCMIFIISSCLYYSHYWVQYCGYVHKFSFKLTWQMVAITIWYSNPSLLHCKGLHINLALHILFVELPSPMVFLKQILILSSEYSVCEWYSFKWSLY